MLLASFFILNRYARDITTPAPLPNPDPIYPYVHSLSIIPNRAAILKSVQIPDALPSDHPPGSDFSLVAGNFEEVYV